MGLLIYEAAILSDISQKEKRSKGTVVALGEPLLLFNRKQLAGICKELGCSYPRVWDDTSKAKSVFTAKEYFIELGYDEYLALDYSDYEGADIVHNLNFKIEDQKLKGVADLIFDAGTVEHVFNTPQVFDCIHDLLKIGGVIIYSSPTNGYLDHGFYQFSPTLFTDYYKANQYLAINGTLIDRAKSGKVRLAPYQYDVYRKESPRFIQDRFSFTLSFFCFEKTKYSTSAVIPIQTFYSNMHSDFEQRYEFKYEYEKVLYSYKHMLLGLLPLRFKKTIMNLIKKK
jgi:SAM-dependent methyltransferase